LYSSTIRGVVLFKVILVNFLHFSGVIYGCIDSETLFSNDSTREMFRIIEHNLFEDPPIGESRNEGKPWENGEHKGAGN
jgi:hypothetical protein